MSYKDIHQMNEHGRVPPGRRVYTYGDVHGRGDLFDRLRAAIARDISENPGAIVTVIGLGDVIDRGPDSARIVADLLEGFPGVEETILLRGNHEEMLLAFIDDPVANGPDWLSNRAAETMRSYGVPVDLSGDVATAALVGLRDRLLAAMPSGTVEGLRSWRVSATVGGYFFSHAGARPGIPLDRQSHEDLVWYRYTPKDADPVFDKVVVHGHTPLSEPFFGRSRINIDTGAVFSGRLTLIALEAGTQRLIPV